MLYCIYNALGCSGNDYHVLICKGKNMINLISYDGATFFNKCHICGRFVKADDSVSINLLGESKKTNATCKKCGRTYMIFIGFTT